MTPILPAATIAAMLRFISAAVIVACCAPIASAQDLSAARAAFERGEQQFEARNYQLALEAFRESHRLLEGDERRQVLVQFNVARSLEELGRYREARDEFRAFLERAPNDAPYREETQDRVRELDARMAASEGPSDGTLLIAGVVSLAAGGVIALGAIPTGVVTLDERSTLDAVCPEGGCPPSEEARLNNAHTMATVTDVLWISGLVVAAAGAVLLGVGLAQNERGETQVTLQGGCAPAIGCHASLGGVW